MGGGLLRPCPFCGGEAVYVSGEDNQINVQDYDEPETFVGVFCNRCYAMIPHSTAWVGKEDNTCVYKWNARAERTCAFASPTDLTDGCAALERIAELERMLEHDRLEILCYEDDVDMRDELIRDMARELRSLKDGGISTDCMEYERRMCKLGIEVDE